MARWICMALVIARIRSCLFFASKHDCVAELAQLSRPFSVCSPSGKPDCSDDAKTSIAASVASRKLADNWNATARGAQGLRLAEVRPTPGTGSCSEVHRQHAS